MFLFHFHHKRQSHNHSNVLFVYKVHGNCCHSDNFLVRKVVKMVRCAINGCENYEGRRRAKVHFFKIPRDISQRTKWIEFFDKSIKNIEGSKVCSDHFKKNDYLLNCKYQRNEKAFLLKQAVPSLCLDLGDRKLG